MPSELLGKNYKLYDAKYGKCDKMWNNIRFVFSQKFKCGLIRVNRCIVMMEKFFRLFLLHLFLNMP